MEDNPYESLDDSSSPSTHMLAGAAAGIMEHTVMYPVDCVKVDIRCDLDSLDSRSRPR